MLRRLKMGTKFAVVGALAVVAIAFVAFRGVSGIDESGPNSTATNQSLEYERLIAEVLPSPQYLVESYLAQYRVLRETRPAQIAELTGRLRLERAQYYERHAQWVNRLSSGLSLSGESPLREAFLNESFAPAETFWRITLDEFVPAIEAGQTARAATLLDSTITAAFNEHRAAIDKVVTLARSQAAAHAADAESDASARRLAIVVTAAIATLLLALAGLLLARSIQRPLRKLADAADSSARDELPRLLASIDHARADTPAPGVASLGLSGNDDLAAIARAFDSVRQAAVDIAVKQAATRRSIADLFVNLGRRNQALVNRQLSFIDQLERTEEDPSTLEGLFRVDHLATRMRRNAESLLVLAGAEQSRRWAESVDVANVVRSALSEIEEYNQVDIGEMDPVDVRGAAVADVAHLLAELLENATAFSPPKSRVLVTGRMVTEGYVISVIDSGIGMEPGILAEANRRIESVGRRDAPSTRVLGLHVVGCLAARHQIRVRLVPSNEQGVTARVLLPMAAIEGPPVPHTPMQAVAFAAPAVYERALSRLESQHVEDEPSAVPVVDGDASDSDEEALPQRRRNEPTLGFVDAEDGVILTPWHPDTPTEPATFVPWGTDAAPEAAESAFKPWTTELWSFDEPQFADADLSFVEPENGEFTVETGGGPEASVTSGESPIDIGDGSPAEAFGAAEAADDDASPARLTRRVRGAQLPEVGAARVADEPSPDRSPDEVRSKLSQFHSGVERGRQERPADSMTTHEGDRP